MARDKANQPNIDNSNPSSYPSGRIRDNDGSGNGTAVDESMYGDMHETDGKLMRLAGITYNSLPDNELNGFQLIDALIALASKNDFVLTLTSDGTLILPLRLNQVKVGEYFICLASADKISETQIKGSLDSTPVPKNIDFKGGDFKSGEYLRVVVTALGVDLIRLSDGDAIDTVAGDFGFLKKASQLEESTGTSDTVATTPLVNKTTFIERINGSESSNYRATPSQDGLLSSTDKAKIDAGDNERNYGTFSPGNINGVSVGFLAPISDDITQAIVTNTSGGGDEYTITFANAFDNTNYQMIIGFESLGTFGDDNDMRPPIYKKVNTTQIKIFLEQSAATVQAIKLHVTGKQR